MGIQPITLKRAKEIYRALKGGDFDPLKEEALSRGYTHMDTDLVRREIVDVALDVREGKGVIMTKDNGPVTLYVVGGTYEFSFGRDISIPTAFAGVHPNNEKFTETIKSDAPFNPAFIDRFLEGGTVTLGAIALPIGGPMATALVAVSGLIGWSYVRDARKRARPATRYGLDAMFLWDVPETDL